MKTALHTQLPLIKAIRKTLMLTAVGVTSSVLHTVALAGPDGGQVVEGDAVIEQSNSNTTIRQNSRRTIIDWRDFSIDSHESVDFIQPDSSSVALNRVTGDGRSYIDGALTANGNVFILNGNGIVFGKNAKVDVGGLLATTNDIRNEDFMRGNFDFNIPGKRDAAIYNYGSISVAEGGLAAFVAPYVENNGLIYARYGRVALGAGYEGFALDLYGDELIRLAVSEEFSERLGLYGVSSEGSILAEAGSILLTAETASEVLSEIITVGGEVRADSVGVQNGSIVLSGVGGEINIQENATLQASGGTIELASASAFIHGSVDVSGDEAGAIAVESGWINIAGSLEANGSSGGSITLRADDIFTSGEISVRGGSDDGGRIDLHASESITQTSSTHINASGQTNGGHIRMTADQQITTSAQFQTDGLLGDGGNIDVSAPAVKSLSAQFLARGDQQGGRVRLGGELQGGKGLSEDELPNAETLVVSSGSLIDVSGGILSAVTGSDTNTGGEAILWSDEYTIFQGQIDGPGAFAEVSSAGTLGYYGDVNIGDGQLLLDPKNIVITDGSQPTTLNLILGFGYDYDETALDADDEFGSAVALDGTHLAVGALGDDGSTDSEANSGAVYLFTFANTELESPSLSAVLGDGYTSISGFGVQTPEAGDQYGYSVALDGSVLLVGAIGDDGSSGLNQTDAGAVYIYSFTGDFASVTQEGIIGYGPGYTESLIDVVLPGDGLVGSSVAIDSSNGLLAVAAEGDDGFNGTYNDTGNVYLYSYSLGGGLTLTRRSVIGDYSAGPLNGFEYFTIGPDLGGGRYADDDDYFGSSLALGDNLLAVGARGDDGQGNSTTNSGAVYLYTFSSTFNAISLEAVIGADYSTRTEDFDNTNLTNPDEFGTALALEGTDLYVGAPEDQSGRGAVYAYSFTGGFTLIIDEGRYGNGFVGANDIDFTLESGDNFGRSLSLDGDYLAIGASGDDGAADGVSASGAVYVIDPNRVDHNFAWGFADSPGNTSVIDVADLLALLDAGTAVTLQAANDVTVETAISVSAGGSGGDVLIEAGRSITIEDDIFTDNGDFELRANQTVPVAVDTHRDAGDASISFTTGSTLNAGTGAVTLTLSDGAGNTETAVGSISLDAITAGSLAINNANSGSSVTDNAALIISGTTDINAAGADVTFDFATNDFDSDDSGDAFTIDAAIAEIFDVDALEIGTSNVTSLVAESGANLTLSGTVTATGDLGDGNDTAIVLAAGSNFVEETGADLNPGAGRFLVYSTEPSSNTYEAVGGLNSAATPWYDTSYVPATPAVIAATGNRLVYTLAPALTVTADDQSRAYGAANPALTQTVTGIVSGDEGLIDTSTVGSASTSASATSSVAGGPYTITATVGSLAGENDYNYAIAAPVNGSLTITPAALTASVDSETLTYDGTAFVGADDATVTFTGFENGETIADLGGTLVFDGDSEGAVNAGTYTISITGLTSTNYTIDDSDTGVLTINPAGLTASVDSETLTYDGTAFVGADDATVTFTGFAAGETIADLGGTLVFDGDSEGAVNAGTYTISITGLTSTNYTIDDSDTGVLTINPAGLTASVDSETLTYDGTAFVGADDATVTFTGFAAGETIADLGGTLVFDGDSEGAVNTGTYTISITGLTSTNYTIDDSDTGVLTINPAALTVTANTNVAGDDVIRTYDGTTYLGDADDVQYQGFVPGDSEADLGGALTFASDSEGAVNTGTYTILASGLTSTNYTITYEAGTLRVDPRSITVTANSQRRNYGETISLGTTGFEQPTNMVAGEVIGEVTLTSLGDFDIDTLAEEGTYAGDIRPSDARGGTFNPSNYDITYENADFVIGLATLTITALGETKTYDGLAYSGGTVVFDGFVNDETSANLDGFLSFATGTSEGAIDVGNYTIQPSGLSSDNYEIEFVDASLTVNPAPLVIFAADQTRTYGDNLDLGSNNFTSSGLVAGDIIDSVSLQSVNGIGANSAAIVGVYSDEIVANNAFGASFDPNNYNINYQPGSLEVTPANLTVTAAAQSRVYGDTADLGTSSFSATGLANGEVIDSVSLSSASGVATDANMDAGTYSGEILVEDAAGTGFDANNYSITYQAADFTVDPRVITLDPVEDSKELGQLDPEFNVRPRIPSDLVNGDSLESVAGDISRTEGEGAGQYDIRIAENGVNSANYDIQFNPDNNAFTITTGVVVPPPEPPPNTVVEPDDNSALPEELEVNIPPVVIDRDDVNSGTVVITVDEDSQVVGAIVLPEGNGEVVIQTETKAPIQARPRTSRFARHSKKKKSKASEPVVITSNVVVEKDGSLTIELSDGRRIGGITTPAAKFSEKGPMLILERDRGIASSPPGLATTISVVGMPKGSQPSFIQHMLLFDEIDQMMLLNFDGAGRPPLKPGKSKARVKFGLIDSQGNPINFIAIVTENGVMVRPQSETAKWLSQGSDDIVPSLALLALQTQLDINLDDVVAVYLVR